MKASEHLSMHLDLAPGGAYRAFVGNLSADDIGLLADGLDQLNTPRAIHMARSLRFHIEALLAFADVAALNPPDTTNDHEQEPDPAR